MEHDGKTFIVIRINEFDDVPVICTKRCDDPANAKKPLLERRVHLHPREKCRVEAAANTRMSFGRLIGTATKKRRDDIIQHLDAMLKGQATELIGQQTRIGSMGRLRQFGLIYDPTRITAMIRDGKSSSTQPSIGRNGGTK